jgi:hypothetical protein
MLSVVNTKPVHNLLDDHHVRITYVGGTAYRRERGEWISTFDILHCIVVAFVRDVEIHPPCCKFMARNGPNLQPSYSSETVHLTPKGRWGYGQVTWDALYSHGAGQPGPILVLKDVLGTYMGVWSHRAHH